jgi:hypothetical protein
VSPEYAAWIAENVDEPYGKCREWSRAMASFYPELRVARGWYDDPIWGQREHWWCVTPAGEIVDPTAAQFPTRGMFPYREITDESEVPTGACLTCGTRCTREPLSAQTHALVKRAGTTPFPASPFQCDRSRP